jgi:DNA-binding HxlR family transcriptional regulator
VTKNETRILYLLVKLGGQARHSQLQQATARLSRDEREAALRALEELGLVSSGHSPSKTRPALLYWLTPAGKDHVEDAIARGDMGDPR